ncbi:DUF4097 family beta strand repeat-containing protein [Shivajiella indica]|uniref:DUF4097 family beta strand repeat-containing protein n=1 Tax=Shivajiella indica TaxID=872115 RepID=A0ABW5BA00_9BACT
MKSSLVSRGFTSILSNKKINLIFTQVFLLGSLMFLSSCLGDDLTVVSELNQDFEGITEVEVDGAFMDVQYIGESGKQVLNLDAVLRSNSDKKYEVKYRIVGSTLQVFIETNSRLFSGGAKGEGYIKLTGPRNMKLDLEAGSGSVDAHNVVATEIELNVGSGTISGRNITSPKISLIVSSGSGRVEDITGLVKATIASGKLDLVRIDGDVEGEGSSGQIAFIDINGSVKSNISSGKIEMTNVKSIGQINVSSGQLFATNSGLSPQTNLKASSGNIYIQTFSNLMDYNYNITAGSGTVRVGDAQSSGTLNINNGSANTIRGEVSSGKIEIVN